MVEEHNVQQVKKTGLDGITTSCTAGIKAGLDGRMTSCTACVISV